MNLEELRAMTQQQVEDVILIDTPHKVDMISLAEIALPIMRINAIDKHRLVKDLVYPGTSNFTGALYYIRRDAWKKASIALLVVNDSRSYEDVLDVYLQTESDLFVVIAVVSETGNFVYHSPEEYRSFYGKSEFQLDYYAAKYREPSEGLSAVAEIWSSAIGWRLSKPVYSVDLDTSSLDFIRYGVKSLPYAGKDMYEIIAAKEYTLIDIPVPGPATIVKASRRGLLLKGKGCDETELKEVLTMAEFYAEHTDLLEDNWIVCTCGNPVYQLGSDFDDEFCPYCDKPIEGFNFVTVEYKDEEYKDEDEDDEDYYDDEEDDEE